MKKRMDRKRVCITVQFVEINSDTTTRVILRERRNMSISIIRAGEIMSRSALLPLYGEMYHYSGLWMKFYERWQHEVDHLYINHNTSGHGQSLAKLVNEIDSEYLMFVEEDGIIFKPGIVDKCFKALESGQYDVIGSPRMSCSPKIAELAKNKWNLNYEGEGDKGPNFWPNFFFVKRSILMQTDLNFANRAWQAGEQLLGETLIETVAGDTMVWMSLQLRTIVPKDRILEIPQYHSCPTDFEDYTNNKNIWDGYCSWLHLGSASGDFTPWHSEIERLEAERRIAWHEMCGKNMKAEIEFFNLRYDNIAHFKEIYWEVLQ